MSARYLLHTLSRASSAHKYWFWFAENSALIFTVPIFLRIEVKSVFAITTATGVSLILLAMRPATSEYLLIKWTTMSSVESFEKPFVLDDPVVDSHSFRTERTLNGSIMMIIPSLYAKLRGFRSYCSLRITSSG